MAGISEITIRELEKDEEFQQLADIQLEVWGFEDADLAAPHLIMVHKHLGGVVLGAFQPSGRIIAFTYSFFGLHQGVPIQWSHMLAVLPEYRGAGLGRALKLKQRELILQRGVGICRWTFDPLEALNARLNIFTLGAEAGEYIVNAYGASSGHLHGGLPTDRFVAHWELNSERAKECAAGRPRHQDIDPGSLPVLIKIDFVGALIAPSEQIVCCGEKSVGVPVPPTIQEIKRQDIDIAKRWRESTRQVFQDLCSRKYRLIDVRSPEEWDGRAFLYIFKRLSS
jgi:predicted GNAT superfamily acetyltransferase